MDKIHYNSFVDIANDKTAINNLKSGDIVEFINGENWLILDNSSNSLRFIPLYNIYRSFDFAAKYICDEYASRFNDPKIKSYAPTFQDFILYKVDKTTCIPGMRLFNDFFVWGSLNENRTETIIIPDSDNDIALEKVKLEYFSNHNYHSGIRPIVKITFNTKYGNNKESNTKEINNLNDHELLVYIANKLKNNKEN